MHIQTPIFIIALITAFSAGFLVCVLICIYAVSKEAKNITWDSDPGER